MCIIILKLEKIILCLAWELRLKEIKKSKIYIDFSKEEFEKQKIYENLLLSTPNYALMKNSIITGIDSLQVHKLKDNVKSLEIKHKKLEISPFGMIPQPRDSHSSCIMGNMLVIFGGDRNRVSEGDVYGFILE